MFQRARPIPLGTGLLLLTVAVPTADAQQPFNARQLLIGGTTDDGHLASGDFDGDGLDDVAIAASGISSIVVLRGHPSGTLQRGDRLTGLGWVRGIEAADLDEDGHDDLVFFGSGLRVALGNGDATFGPSPMIDSTGTYGIGVADFDEDGHLDVVSTYLGGVSLRLGDGSGALGPALQVPVVSDPIALDVADLDRDGHLDVALVSISDSLVHTVLGDGQGNLTPGPTVPVVSGPNDVGAADLDGNNRVDLIVANCCSVAVALGLPDGTWADAQLFAGGNRVEALDWNGDGHLDLLSADFGGVFLAGDGAGGFAVPESLPLSGQTVAIEVLDFDGDGYLDLIGSAASDGFADSGSYEPFQRVTQVRGAGQGTVAHAVRSPGDGVPWFTWRELVDVNLDGAADVIGISTDGSEVNLRLGDGNGGFGPSSSWPSGIGATHVRVADATGNGIPDLVASMFVGAPAVSVLVGNGAGSFAAPVVTPISFHPNPSATGDVNGDGRDDFVGVSNPLDELVVILSDGLGGFSAPVTSPSFGAAPFNYAFEVVDADLDGHADVVAGSFPAGLAVYKGNGAGTFVGQASTSALAGPGNLVLGDLDGDSVLDGVTGNSNSGFCFCDQNTTSVLLGSGSSTFLPATLYATGKNAVARAVVDVTGDGDADAVLSSQSGTAVLRGNGDGRLDRPVFFGGSFLGAADTNGDGRPDLVMVDDESGGFLTLLNQGP